MTHTGIPGCLVVSPEQTWIATEIHRYTLVVCKPRLTQSKSICLSGLVILTWWSFSKLVGLLCLPHESRDRWGESTPTESHILPSTGLSRVEIPHASESTWSRHGEPMWIIRQVIDRTVGVLFAIRGLHCLDQLNSESLKYIWFPGLPPAGPQRSPPHGSDKRRPRHMGL